MLPDRLQQVMGLARSLVLYRRPGRQKSLRHLYSGLVRPGDLVFDIGAHLGDRTEAFAALGARVVAVEPQPQLMRWLQRLTGHKDRVIFLASAVGRQPGTAQLALSYRTPTVSSLAPAWRQHLQATSPGFHDVSWDRSITVPVTTLDELIRQYGLPRFCKIDVEGFETEVLAGLSQPLPALSFEFVNGALEQARQCLEELERLGIYEFNVIAGEERQFIWPSWQDQHRVGEWLSGVAGDIASGDIYARQVSQ